jgi:hypothetical protein
VVSIWLTVSLLGVSPSASPPLPHGSLGASVFYTEGVKIELQGCHLLIGLPASPLLIRWTPRAPTKRTLPPSNTEHNT